jgi:hypothetical protein
MSTTMWVLAFIYGLIILGNFVCQVYVARLVFRGECCLSQRYLNLA